MKINGKNLAKILKVNPKDYKELYPNRKEAGYCPCMDLFSHTEYCNGMLTVIEAFNRKHKYEIPDSIRTISSARNYKSGEVWIDKTLKIAYLYIGKNKEDKDVVLNLGGETSNAGKIMTGRVNKKHEEDIFFEKRVFPKE